MKTSLLRFALLLAFVSPSAAFGQCCPYIDGIEVHPSTPNSNDPLTIVYTVTTPNMGAYLGATHTIDGDTVVVNACYYMGMLTALQTFVDSITIAPLPEGLHFVRLHASISSDMVECIPTQSQNSVISFSVAKGGPMPICDSVFASPDTFFVQQGTDTSVNLTVSYTGASDISYSMVRFIFNDSTLIDINDMNVTNGVAGPFTYASDFELIYNQLSIPDNTVVPAEVWIFHDGPASPVVDCRLSVTFVIEEATSVVNRAIASTVSIYPNPVAELLSVNGIDGVAEVAVYDATGKPVISKQVNDRATLDVTSLPVGVYALVVRTNQSVTVERFTKQ